MQWVVGLTVVNIVCRRMNAIFKNNTDIIVERKMTGSFQAVFLSATPDTVFQVVVSVSRRKLCAVVLVWSQQRL